jgi:hypothetical protein
MFAPPGMGGRDRQSLVRFALGRFGADLVKI